jgi:signal transduction histidine kinase
MKISESANTTGNESPLKSDIKSTKKAKQFNALVNLGISALKVFRLDEAEKHLKQALLINPKAGKSSISKIYHNLGEVYTKKTKMDEGLVYFNMALAIRRDLNLKKGTAETLNKIGVNYFYQGEYSKALEYFNESLKIIRKTKESRELISSCLNNICMTYYHKSYYKKALEFGLEAQKICEKYQYRENLGLIYNNIGLIYFEMSLFPEALDCQFKALEYKKLVSSKPVIANTLNNIAMIFTRLFNLEKALEYSEEALEMRRSVNDIRGIANSYNEIGRIYDKMNRYDKAVSYLQDAIKMRREMNFPSGLAVSLENLGMIYLKQSKFDEAEKNLFEAKRICEELDEKKNIAGINRNIASLYMMKGMLSEALVYIKRSFNIAKEMDIQDKLRDAYRLMSEIYGRKNNFKKALAFYVQYSKTNEEIINLQKQNEINSITVRYENFRKENESEIYRLKNIELTKINKELRKSKSDLQKSNSAKDKFFSIIAHDLKNPFSILYTTSELLSSYFDELSVKKQKEYINTINVSTIHILRLIENLLEWSRTQTGMKQFDPTVFNFAESIDQCVELINPSAELKNIMISVSAEKEIKIRADKNMLKTICRNFLTNAIKFTKKGGKILIEAYIADSVFYFKIKDNGVGIRKRDLSKLFMINKHFVTNGTANEKGTGIGLLLCKEFIDKHKGKLIAESVFGKGSTFGFEIPVK